MAKYCGKCGFLLDETSKECLNCNKAEFIKKQDTLSNNSNEMPEPKSKKKNKRSHLTKRQKTVRLILKITAIILSLVIAVGGCFSVLVYKGVIDSDLLDDFFEYINIDKKVASVDRDLAPTNDSEFVFYKSGDENIVQNTESGIRYVNNEILITLDSQKNKSELDTYLTDIDAKIVGEIPAVAEYQILLEDERTYEELIKLCSDLEKNDWVKSASLNYALEVNPDYIPNDKKWKNKWEDVPEGTNWGLEAISVAGAWDNKGEMQTVNIGVIDNMFDLKHEDLVFAETPLGMYNMNSELEQDKSEWNNHGTHTAGTIAATFDNKKGISGIVPKSNLYGVAFNWLESAASTTLQAWKVAFYYLIVTNNCKVINISLGYNELCFNASRGSKVALSTTESYSTEIGDFLHNLIELDYQFVICKSAGNQNEVGGGYKYFKKDHNDKNAPYEYYDYSDYVSYLNGEEGYDHFERYKDRHEEIKQRLESGNVSANFDFLAAITHKEVKERIIVVGAVENLGSHKEGGFLGFGRKIVHDGYKMAAFSQCGDRVDVLAPGVDTYSTIQNGYKNMSGTSMAAPHVAGVAGMVFAVNPNIDGKAVKEIICNNTDGQYGQEKYGLLNAQKAVNAAKNYRTTVEKPVIVDDIDVCIDNFEDMLNTANIYFNGNEDFSKLLASDLIRNYIALDGMPCGLYEYFSGETIHYTGYSMGHDGGYNDPQKRFFTSYELEADEVNWILENVFERTTEDIILGDNIYYHGDKVYILAELGGGPGIVFDVKEYNLIEDNKYEIFVRSNFDNDSLGELFTNYIFVASIEYDAQRGFYWRLYSCEKTDKTIQQSNSDVAWKNAYIDFINSSDKGNESIFGFESYDYYLINIDDDGIPELHIEYLSVAGGADVCSYQNGEIIVQHIYDFGLSYIEKQGLFLDSGGRMDHYHDKVYSLKNGSISLVSSGEWIVTWSPEGNEEYSEEYSWDGKLISKEEYDSRLNTYFDKSQAISPYEENQVYDCYEIISAINEYSLQ